MKKTTRTVLLLGVLGFLATGCQKEVVVNDNPVTTLAATQTAFYSLNGVIYASDEDCSELMNRLVALAREGYEITLFHNNAGNAGTSKEKVVFTTQDPDAAAGWAEMMYKNGYTVTITYDKTTGTYTCIAIK